LLFFFVVSVPTSQTVPSMIPIVQQKSKILKANRPTVNSLMHLYGPWILDACLLQIKDRYSRSTNTNDRKRRTKIWFHWMTSIF